jgi:diguanylate cyclase (GGDEF)-like protein/PAS domain S-box-containing protein
MNKRISIRILQLAVIAAGLCLSLHVLLMRGFRSDQALEISLRLAELRTRIEKEVTGNLLRVQGAANFISINPALTQQEFNRYAREALHGTDLLRNLAAAPDLVITYVYPLKGNEAALGLDYRTIPTQWEQAQQAMRTSEMVVAGPLPLVQGGTGLVGRAPVIIRGFTKDRFWGLVSAVIDIGRLYETVGLTAVTDLRIAIRGVDGKGDHGMVFYGDAALFAPGSNAVFMTVTFPSGTWQMAALPAEGAPVPDSLPLMYAVVLALFFATTTVSYTSLRRSHELDLTRQRLTEAQHVAHLGNWDLDLTRDTVWLSDETYAIFGLDKATFTPTLENIFAVCHEDDRENVEREFAASLKTGKQYAMTHRIVRSDGQVRFVYAQGRAELAPDGHPVRSMGTIYDITELKEAEAALRAKEQTLRAMSDASLDGIIMSDARGIVLFWNAAAVRLFGYTEEEALGRDMHRMITLPDDAQKAHAGLPHFGRTGEGPVINATYELRGVRKDQTSIPIELSVSAFEMDGEWYAVGILRDIAKRVAARNKLSSYAKRIALASEAGGVGVWEWDTVTDELTWDKRMRDLYAVLPGEFSGMYRAWTSRVHPEDLDEAESSLQALGREGGDWNKRFRILLPGGGIRYIQAAARAHKDATGRVISIVGINQDVTEQQLARQELKRLATEDGLTGLFNRRYFMELGTREFESSKRYGDPLSVIMFDADKFKTVNDTYGHDVGDTVLKTIAKSALGNLRDVDVLGRIGGEEFAVVLPHTSADMAVMVAERFRQDIAATRIPAHNGITITITLSFGVCQMFPEAHSLDDLLKKADEALYQAKQNGRNRVERA